MHRDIKPENLFLHRRDDGSHIVKLLDFGVSKFLAGELSATGGGALTATGALLGTPLYMAPEQARGQVDQISAATDVWAIGMIAYRCLTGQAYWSGHSVGELMAAILTQPMLPPTAAAAGQPATFAGWQSVELPPAFDAWFARSCHREPAARFPSVRAQSQALAQAFGVVEFAGVSAQAPAVDPAGPTDVSSPPAVAAASACVSAGVSPAVAAGAAAHAPGAAMPYPNPSAVTPVAMGPAPMPPSPQPATAPSAPVAALPPALAGAHTTATPVMQTTGAPRPAPSRKWLWIVLVALLLGAAGGAAAVVGARRPDERAEAAADQQKRKRKRKRKRIPRVTTAHVMGGSGDYTTATVIKAVKPHLGELKTCYVEALEYAPELSGTLQMMFAIDRKGKPKRVMFGGLSTIRNDDLRSCVIEKVGSWKLPRNREKSHQVSFMYTFRFELVELPPPKRE